MSIATILIKKCKFKIKEVQSFFDIDRNLCSEFVWVKQPSFDKPITIVYCRVSTQKQVSNSSLENQITSARKVDPDLIIVEVGSGFTYRKGFKKLMELLQTSSCKSKLVAFNMTRLARNEADFRELLACMMEREHTLIADPLRLNDGSYESDPNKIALDIVRYYQNFEQKPIPKGYGFQGTLLSKNLGRKSILTLKLYNKYLKNKKKFPKQTTAFHAKKLGISIKSFYNLRRKFVPPTP